VPVILVLVLSYLLGSIPMGWLVVKILNGKDIRKIQSGRTGGTNAMRAAGLLAGLITAALDILKGMIGVWLAKLITPEYIWVSIFAPIFVVIGHNYSIFLIERNENGRFRVRGGAGGAPSTGGAIGLWPPIVIILIPIGALILFGIGYASVATMSIPILVTLVFAYRAWIGATPWHYIFYGIITEIILVISLRPNIRRLINGNERLIGWRARRLSQVSIGNTPNK
jgi:glycerol-3-phosphate acyltransferase PlsY